MSKSRKYIVDIALLLMFLFCVVPTRAATDTGEHKLSLKAVTGAFVESKKAGQLFVIKGKVVNKYDMARTSILLQANIFDDRDNVIRSRSVYAGYDFTENEINEMSWQEINATLANRPGKEKGNIGPGENVAFMIIFKNLPKTSSEFTVEASSSSPGEISAAPQNTMGVALLQKPRSLCI